MAGPAVAMERLDAHRPSDFRRVRSVNARPLPDRPRFAVSGAAMSICTCG